MKSKILKFFAKIIAKFYWGYLKHEIDTYVINIQKPYFKYYGKNVIFKGGGEIFHPENIIISDNVQIGNGYFLMGIGGISIGEGTIISRNVCIHSGNHEFTKYDYLPYNKNYIKQEIIIGKAVWIGQNVNILPGVKIGDGAIIGMGTTVSKEVKEGEIVVGKGQRVIQKRDIAKINKLIKEKKYFSTL